MGVILEKKDGIARITLDRPPVNVLDIKTMVDFNIAIDRVKLDPDVKVIVIDGKGKHFSAGVDVKDHTPDKVHEMVTVFHKMFHLLSEVEQPTIASIRGSVLGGGCELALFCDMVIASETAKLGQPEIKVGVFPPIAAFILPRLCGRKKAIELLLTGDIIDAREAWRIGLVNEVVADDKLEEATNNLVKKLTTLSNIVVRLTKKAASGNVDTEFKQKLAKIEDIYLNELMKTRDASEGLTAFMEKRAPVWLNK
ncbi:MAG: enoyl-CoA hydratase-related protein [Chloroflexi bacterium]|nr:enoyl-CoA hydratase-related protein [Chloroflexota bacterium]